MAEWFEKTIGDVVEFFDHKRVPLSSQQRSVRKGPYPYYGASGEIDYIDDYIFDGKYLLIAEDGENLNSRKLPIAFFGTGKFWVNNHAHIVRGVLGKADDDFLKHWFADANISGYITGAAQPKLSQANLRAIKIKLPNYGIQQKIASILSAYDDLIENNLKRIKILEEMAQMIYREWFVNFRFPCHEKVKMVKSELGMIPEGWEVKRASDCIEINPKMIIDKDVEKSYVDMGGLSKLSMVIHQSGKKTGISGSKFMNGDTLFARITPCLENGKTGFVQFLNDGEVGIGSTEFIVLRSQNLSPQIVYLLSRTDEFRNNAIKSMTGASGRQRVQNECFDNFMLAKPPREIIDRFSEIVRPMFSIIHIVDLKNDILRKTRDLLLPKLISGEIDVEDLDIDTENFN